MTPRWQRSPAALWRRTLGATIVLGAAGDPVRLRGTAEALWDELTSSSSAAELAERVAGTSSPEVVADLELALHVLVETGAVVAS